MNGHAIAGDKTIEGHGLALTVPDSWDGRVITDADAIAVLQAGSQPLPANDGDGGDGAIEALKSGDMYINVLDYITPDDWMETSPVWANSLPVSFDQTDLSDPEPGVNPKVLGRRFVLANGSAVVVTLAFGEAKPTSDELAAGNQILSSLSVSKP